MLRNIGLLFLLVIGSQILIVIVMNVTGMPYRASAFATFAILGLAIFALIFWFSFRIYRTNQRATEAMRRANKIFAEKDSIIADLRVEAEAISDPQAKADALATLADLESR